MNSMFVYKSDGIFRNQAEVDAHVNADGEPLQPNARPGWIRYVDIDGDGEIGPDDRIIIDNSSIMPKYTFGFDLNFGYKNWALDANFQGIAGIRYYQTGNMAFPLTMVPTPPANGSRMPGHLRTRTPDCRWLWKLTGQRFQKILEAGLPISG